MNTERTPSRIYRLTTALLAASLAAVAVTAAPASAENHEHSIANEIVAGSTLTEQGASESGRDQARRSTTGSLVERPEFAFTPCPELTDSVMRLYSAYFLRAPDEGGFNFWLDEYSAGNWSLPRMSAFFSESPEFAELYGGITDDQFIDLIYVNIFGRQADEEGRNFWLGRMANEGLDRGTVMLFFSESPEYIEQTGTVRPLAGDFNWYPEGTQWYCGFGDIDAAVPSDTYLDLTAYNNSRQQVDVTVAERINGEWQSVVVPLAPNEYLAAFGVPMDGTSDALELTSRGEFFWIMVHSPVPTPRERAGWVFA